MDLMCVCNSDQRLNEISLTGKFEFEFTGFFLIHVHDAILEQEYLSSEGTKDLFLYLAKELYPDQQDAAAVLDEMAQWEGLIKVDVGQAYAFFKNKIAIHINTSDRWWKWDIGKRTQITENLDRVLLKLKFLSLAQAALLANDAQTAENAIEKVHRNCA